MLLWCSCLCLLYVQFHRTYANSIVYAYTIANSWNIWNDVTLTQTKNTKKITTKQRKTTGRLKADLNRPPKYSTWQCREYLDVCKQTCYIWWLLKLNMWTAESQLNPFVWILWSADKQKTETIPNKDCLVK